MKIDAEVNDQVLETIPDIGICEWHIQNDNIDWSDNAYEILGIKPENFDGTFNAYLNLIHPQDKTRVHRDIQKALRSKHPFAINHRIIAEGDNAKYLHFCGYIAHDVNDQPLKIIGAIQDITASKSIENKLAKSEQQLKEAQRLGKIGSWEWDIENDKIHWSDQLYQLFDINTGDFDLTYSSYLDLLHPEDRTKLEKCVNAAINSHNPYSVEHRVIASDNSIRYIYSLGEVILNGKGIPILLRGTAQDITDRVNNEKLLLGAFKNDMKLKRQQQRNTALALLKGQEVERSRIAMELHDGLGQMCSLIKMKMNTFKTRLNSQKHPLVSSHVDEITDLLEDADIELRMISDNLTPRLLSTFGLSEAIGHLVENIFVPTDLKVDLTIKLGQEQYDNFLSVAVFRIVQEAFTNIIKHANATQVTLNLLQNENELFLVITDDGDGFDLSALENQTSRGAGLLNIFQRVDILNAIIKIDTAPKKGCTISLNIPIHDERDENNVN